MNISENELLDALRDALAGSTERPEGFSTTGELAEATGKSVGTIKLLLSKLHAKGEIECAFIAKPAIDGRLRKSPAYRIRPGQDSAA